MFKLFYRFKPFSQRNYSSYKLLNVTTTEGNKLITLNNPKTRNALSIAMMQELIEAIQDGQDDTTLRTIAITAPPPIFSSGHNLKEMGEGEETVRTVFKLATQLMKSIIDSQVPVIAKVNGTAAAAGCQLVAQCDFALCTADSSFLTPGANFGVFCSTPGVAVGRSVHRSQALQMLLTGMRIDAEQALRSGLVVSVCSDEKQLDEKVNEMTSAIARCSRNVIRQGRSVFYQQIGKDVCTAYEIAEKAMIDGCSSTDGMEGIRSFSEKRKPLWKHVN